MSTTTVTPWRPFDYRDRDRVATSVHNEVASVAIGLSVDLPSSAPAPPAVLTGWVHLANTAAGTEE